MEFRLEGLGLSRGEVDAVGILETLLRDLGFRVWGCSGDTTPCEMSGGPGDTTPCRMTGVTLHGVVSLKVWV